METTFQRRFARLWRMTLAAAFFLFSLAVAMTLMRAAVESGPGGQGTEPTQEWLRAAVAANPRDSAAWIELGLAAEREHEFVEAARSFAQAEKVDRRYLPAWSSANFHFRQGNAENFWDAAARAAAMIYDDPRPLVDLADHMEPDPVIALGRLHAPPSVERDRKSVV